MFSRDLPTASILLFLAGCGGDSGISPAPSFANLAGTYTGEVVGRRQGVSLLASFSIAIIQNGGDLSGSYAITGTLRDGILEGSVQETGSFSGTIASGQDPSVNLTLTNRCPNYSARFSGALDSANDLLTLSGPVDTFFNDCSIFLTYQSVILLHRSLALFESETTSPHLHAPIRERRSSNSGS